jgi:cell division inhibitor SulA/protein ImuA
MDLEGLLSDSLLWRGSDSHFGDIAAIATGFAELDRYLPGGGWPLTGISEIFIERYGLGELSVLMPALAALSRRAAEARRWIVWVAPPFVPYAPALAHHGVDLSRILLVHPSGSKKAKKGSEPFSDSGALWAVEQAIRSKSSLAVLAWVRAADMSSLRRLQLGAEACRCWTVLFRPLTAIDQGSPAALRFRLSAATGSADTQQGIHLEIQRCRGRKPRQFLL